MKRGFFIILCLVVLQSAHAKRLYGLERLERVDRLPELMEGTRAFQVSSRDRRGGNDGDGYYATHPCLYTDSNGEKVLYDERQPGCLYRFWMTFTSPSVLTNHLRFYFDGSTVPAIDLTVGEFFSGTNAPFLFPLVGDAAQSCLGYYSYCPFPYAEGLKVTISSVPTNTGYKASPFYYNITAHRYDSTGGRHGFLARSNRSYTVWTSTDLPSGEWSISTNLTGSGLWIELLPGEANIFHRIEVSLDD